MNRDWGVWAWVVLAVCLTLMAAMANAATVSTDLSWEPPTTREDGTPLAPTEIAEYRIYITVDGEAVGEPVVVANDTTETVTLELAPRAEQYVVAFQATAVDTNGRESDRSNRVEQAFVVASTADPSPPTQLRLNITCGDGCTITPVQ